MTHKLKTIPEVCAAIGAGKEVEYRCMEVHWKPVEEYNIGALLFRFQEYVFRIKPEPEMVPLEMADINLHRDLFRFACWPSRVYNITAKSPEAVVIAGKSYTWFALKGAWEYSIDYEETWRRCEKEVVQ